MSRSNTRKIKMDVFTIHGPLPIVKEQLFQIENIKKNNITILIVISQQCLKMKKGSIKQCQNIVAKEETAQNNQFLCNNSDFYNI